MFLTRDMAEAFGDHLELDRIQRALLAARPDLDGAMTSDALRPLLRIARPSGDALLVARAAEDTAGRWLIGIPSTPAPILHEAGSPEAVVDLVLSVLK